MKAHHQNTERLIKEISAEKSTNIAVVFHTSRGETCPPRSQWIHRSVVPPEHERLLTCAPLHCLRGTRFTPFTDLIFSIFSSFTRWQTKMMGDVLLTGSPYDQMSPPFFPRPSALHLPQFSALQRSAWNYRGRHAATWTTIDWHPAELSRNHKRL